MREKYPLLFFTARAPGHSELPNKIYLDLVEANRRQLLAAGVPAKNITASPLCTSCHTDTSVFLSRRKRNHRQDDGSGGNQSLEPRTQCSWLRPKEASQPRTATALSANSRLFSVIEPVPRARRTCASCSGRPSPDRLGAEELCAGGGAAAAALPAPPFHQVFQFLAGLEKRNFLGGDFHAVPGLRIAAHPRLALAGAETAETRESRFCRRRAGSARRCQR